MKSVKDFDFENKTVVLRCDFNVPIKDGKIVDDTRIKSSLKTINYLLDNGARVVILSHLGKVKSVDDLSKNSLEVVYKRLNELTFNKFKFISSLEENVIKDEVSNLEYGKGILLENTRFYDLDGKRESSFDDKLALFWASLGDIFINDAFGTLHRKHTSNYGVSLHLPSGIGFLVEEELEYLDKLDNPDRPFGVIMGGSKVSDKLAIIDFLIKKVDYLFVGGAMAFTFLKAKGYDIGNSLYEEEQISYCKDLLDKYEEKIILPIDFYGSDSFSNDNTRLEEVGSFSFNFMGLDIGDKSISLFKDKLKNVNTLFWNGPLGVYEFDNYKKGTKEIMSFVCDNIRTSIIGGGDIVTCVNEFGFSDKVTFVSTGGGASLNYIVDKNLPGLVNIESR